MALLVSLLLICLPARAAVPTDPAGWRAAAEADLRAIHDILRDNSPAMVVDKDSARFRNWLEQGLKQARRDLPKVANAQGYGILLRSYVAGFRDSHVQLWPTDDSVWDPQRPVAWPGFVVGLRRHGYEVVYREAAAAEAPALGARLIGCDGDSPPRLERARDRYVGDFSRESQRFNRAALLLLDRGDPFIPRPEVCRFEEGGKARDRALSWRPMPADDFQRAKTAAAGWRERALDVAPWDNGAWWIGIPGMGEDHDWNAFFAKVDKNLSVIRAAPLVVVDVRGNGGGSSAYAEHLARQLWGKDFVDAHAPESGPSVWRATKLNRDYFARMAADIEKHGNQADDLVYLKSIVERYDQALAAGKPTFTLEEPASVRPRPGANPMSGRVVVLADYGCNSACLDLLDLFLAMPRAVQAGTTTDADTIFMELTQAPMPSGLSGLAFGHKAWIKRPRGSNRPYVPKAALTWRGEPSDDDGERRWLLQKLGIRP